jgi:hypothetical protein
MAIDKLKHNTPIATDIDRPLLISTTFKGMQSPTGNIHIVDITGCVQRLEPFFQPSSVLRLDPSCITVVKNFSSPLCLKLLIILA